MNIKITENKIIGNWISKNGSIIKDDVTKRIEFLISNNLKKIATDTSGWDVLYIDSSDGRLWELVYLQSEMHGGGPPSLLCISKEEAIIKYALANF